jgi:hypothetical protein
MRAASFEGRNQRRPHPDERPPISGLPEIGTIDCASRLDTGAWSGGIESASIPLIPAKAGIQGQGKKDLDSRVRGNERNLR